MVSTGELRAAAVAYASYGWRVVPLHPRAKNPRPRNWPEAASDDIPTVERWWDEIPDGNVGVALGSGSGLVGVDIDSDEGSRLLHDMAAGEMPETLEMTTGKGSRLLYAIPESLEVEPRTTIIKGADGTEALRFQGRGGQCVMPPSVHPSGKLYSWVENRGPDRFWLAPMPGWLYAEMCRPERPDHADPPRARTPDGPGVAADFNRRESWDGWLSDWGYKRAGGRGDVRYYTRPGKQSGVSVSVGHCKAQDGTPALYVFSGSIPALPPNKAYDLFGAYARVEFRGDFGAAGKHLYAIGYGERAKPGAAIEERVARLERIVEQLTAGRPPGVGNG